MGSIQVVHRSKYKEQFSMDYRERRSNARGVHPTQDTSRMGTVMVKQNEKEETTIMAEE